MEFAIFYMTKLTLKFARDSQISCRMNSDDFSRFFSYNTSVLALEPVHGPSQSGSQLPQRNIQYQALC